MQERHIAQSEICIAAQCSCGERDVPARLSALDTEGCVVEGAARWAVRVISYSC